VKLARRETPAEIPTASMADVAFLLIIFFLVTSIYSVTRGIQFRGTTRRSSQPSPKRPC
jgi:biopolymer transport protein ExbD